MNILQAIILGIVQGLTEFLPVSSSGHLVMLQRMFGMSGGNMFFTVMLHVGTLIAVCFVFWKDIWYLITHPLSKPTLLLLLSTAITGIFYVVLGTLVDESFSGNYLAWGFLYTAVILFVSDKLNTKSAGKKTMNGIDAMIIGGMQGIALFPGVSRSGSTIAGGLFCGLDRDYAARYSFLLSIPAIVVSGVMELKDAIEGGVSDIPWLSVIVGMICAMAAGLFAIKMMLKIIRQKKLAYFSIYLVVIALLILADQFIFHIFF